VMPHSKQNWVQSIYMIAEKYDFVLKLLKTVIIQTRSSQP
jgi:hypothetical protein